MKNTKLDLFKMLTYCRPARSATEEEFIHRYIDSVPDMTRDAYGNRILECPGSKVMISCHTDTVHKNPGKQHLRVVGPIVDLSLTSKSNCLGADDTAGVYAALRMIRAGVKATFVFHRDEEIGGKGSRWLAANYPDWIGKFDICLALDRRGTTDIITSQSWAKCASDEFAWSLAEQLGMGHSPAEGIFTDSANYVDLIPECSNISVGYQHEHTGFESLNVHYLECLIDRLVKVDWTALDIVRDPFAEEELVGWDFTPLWDTPLDERLREDDEDYCWNTRHFQRGNY